jgi:hypothetical protein
MRFWGLFAVALFLGSLGGFAALKATAPNPVLSVLWWEGYAVLLTGLIAIQAFSNGGIALSWALAFGAVVGVILNHGGIALTGEEPELLDLIGLAVAGGLIAAFSLGTLGFALGTAARKLTT